jgi:hypothetical protein
MLELCSIKIHTNNYAMKNIFFIHCSLYSCALLLSCCKSSITVSDLQPQGEFTQKLPRLTPVFDTYPMATASSLVDVATTMDSIARSPILDASKIRTTKTSYAQDANAHELLVYFARDVERNMTRNTGERKGSIACKVTALESAIGRGWISAHSLAFGAAPLTGTPLSSCSTSIEIEVVIRDQYSNPVKRYWGIAHTKKYAGLFYGYCLTELPRATKLAAFQKALDSVKQQIEMDFYRLEKELG